MGTVTEIASTDSVDVAWENLPQARRALDRRPQADA
jgi:hypothetical protein